MGNNTEKPLLYIFITVFYHNAYANVVIRLKNKNVFFHFNILITFFLRYPQKE